ncbi:YHYH protein [Dokdonella sp.]|uniref:YHYH protein n=1 Tax=Dokdonella sp. TaxID=2291710 RepID=UPI003C4C60AD
MRSSLQSLGIGLGLVGAACGFSGDAVALQVATSSDDSAPSGVVDEVFRDGFELVVDAGYGLVSVAGRSLQLNAFASGYTELSWQQVEGPTTSLSSNSVLNPILTLPAVASSQTLVYELTASNGAGSAVADRVSVEIWVGADSSADRTVLGDFSSRSQWSCDKLPVAAPAVAVSDNGAKTAITGNGIPDHTTGTFPNAGNPNTISGQVVAYEFSNTPTLTGIATDMQEFGVSLNGVKLERDTAESYLNQRVWSYEAITPGLAEQSTAGAQFTWLGTDCNNAHVQPTGAYHYHGLMESVINALGETNGVPSRMILGGYAADGFPYYLRYGYNDPDDANSGLRVIQASWELRSGTRASAPFGAYDGTFRQDWEYVAGSGDTDQCGGRFGVTPEYPGGIYYYTITDDYPYIPRCVFGTPDPSFRAMMGPPMP